MRKVFEMTEAQLNVLIEAGKPVPYMIIGGPPLSPQQNANMAWERLGNELDFQHMTVQPIPGKGVRFFTAETALVSADSVPQAI